MSKASASAAAVTPRAVVVAVQVCLLITCCKERDPAEEPAGAGEDVGPYHNSNNFQLFNEVYGTGLVPQATVPSHQATYPTDYSNIELMYMQRYMEYMQYMRNAGFGMQQEWGQPAMVQDPGIVEPSAAMTGVQELDRWTAGDVVGGDRAVFMVLYTNSAECPVCVALAPHFQQLGLHFQGEPAVIIAKADGVAQSPLVEEYGMTDAPLPTGECIRLVGLEVPLAHYCCAAAAVLAALYFAPGAKTPVAYDGPSHYTSVRGPHFLPRATLHFDSLQIAWT